MGSFAGARVPRSLSTAPARPARAAPCASPSRTCRRPPCWAASSCAHAVGRCRPHRPRAAPPAAYARAPRRARARRDSPSPAAPPCNERAPPHSRARSHCARRAPCNPPPPTTRRHRHHRRCRRASTEVPPLARASPVV
eukprot:5041965-Prymnesium_polylepis.1